MDAGKIANAKIDESLGIFLPFRIERFLLFDDVARQIAPLLANFFRCFRTCYALTVVNYGRG